MDREANYLVWMKRRQILMMNSIKDTWEERAFMEDASGRLGGGCMWPPRSYSCSFCRREFRSAQALGGHMNVHRRDRARLKQSLGPYNIEPPSSLIPAHNNSPMIKPSTLMEPPHFSIPEICTLGCNPDITSSGGSLSSSRVSALSTQEGPNDHHHATTASPLISSSSTSSMAQEHQKGCPNPSPEAAKSTSPRGEELVGNTTKISTSDVADLFVGLNPNTCFQIPPTCSSGNHEATSTTTCKRFKASTSVSTLSLLVSNDRCSLQLGHNYSASSVDEIDLELRLGEPPKVK